MAFFEPTDVDPRLAPFACCDADEYDPAMVSSSGRLISAVGLARAPRLRRQFMQTCVRYAIYSLLTIKPDLMSPQLDLVPFSSFLRPASAAPLMARALAPMFGHFVHNHIKVCEYNHGPIDVIVCCKTSATTLCSETGPVDEHTRNTINGALAAAAAHAIDSTQGSPHERAIVIDSVDLFEAFPHIAGHLRSTRPGFSCPAGYSRHLIRKAVLDVSSVVCG
ncbi:hypothetical protein pqer_cds_772 [Pandoravirus quercus]|uniref:Uncharacterized protein n=1 Tax=Pandoravirus quercus TaxID=2107709 RepID=A0A2U7U9T1_9VIRU|nr:hypothetical protein pqer_cds_772 [Pandoravirus quercus]AVK75194.1 hypothetical protein pqer_cds_772 [Pandoravirus quercus]